MLVLPLVGIVTGALCGLAFFGGLWWTTQRLVSSPRPAVLLLTSMLARFALLALCLVGLARLNPSALVAALVGIVGVRMVMTRVADAQAIAHADERRALDRSDMNGG